MKHRTLWAVIGMTVGLLLSGIALPARADIGPKPSMDFTFVAATDVQPDIVAAVLYECTDPSCADAQPLPEIGPQGFTCQARSCHSLAYGYADYLRLRVRFSDGVTRESNVFSKRAFQARYTVTIEPTSLQVKEQAKVGAGFNGPLGALLLLGTVTFLLPLLVLWVIWCARGGKDTAPSSWLLIATWGISAIGCLIGLVAAPTVVLTVLLEVAVLFVYARRGNRSLPQWLTLGVAVNLLTQPLLWILPASELWPTLVFAEVGIWLAEALLLYLPLRREATFPTVLLLSLVMNVLSFGVGLLLPV